MSTESPAADPTAIDLGNLHVLLVDDDSTFLKLMETMLKAIGVNHITLASSGRDAYEKLLSNPRVVDCILCDNKMAEGTGLQLLYAVRTGMVKAFRPDACFVLLTASGDHETVAVAAQLDINGYLIKPVTPQKLKAAITTGRRRAIKIDFQKYKQVVLPGA